jgi:hypothetical protein
MLIGILIATSISRNDVQEEVPGMAEKAMSAFRGGACI